MGGKEGEGGGALEQVVWSRDSPAASGEPIPDQAADRTGEKLRLGTREGVVSREREGVLSFVFVLFNWQ